MHHWRRVAFSTAVAALVVSVPAGAPSAGAVGAAPAVLVTGDSLSHQAEDEIRDALAGRGYPDVTFAVYGGTTIGWSADQVRRSAAPIVVFATGTMHAFGGWTAEEAQEASDAVALLSDRDCAVWVLPEAARYPSGREVADPDAAAVVRGIRQVLGPSPVAVADWAEVADAVPEIHTSDGVHHTERGQQLLADLVAGAVAGGCTALDPAITEANARYVDAVHRILLARGASSAETTRWGGMLDRGHPRIAFARRLGTTPEWVDGQIAELYRLGLGREPEPDGLAHWRAEVVAGRPLADVAADVYGSREARALAGGTDAGLVSALYRGLLQREADTEGLSYWTGRMAAGMPSAEVARAFHGSVESRRDRVRRLYRAILQREPDGSGLDHWAEALVTEGDLRLAATLAASQELYDRTAGPPMI